MRRTGCVSLTGPPSPLPAPHAHPPARPPPHPALRARSTAPPFSPVQGGLVLVLLGLVVVYAIAIALPLSLLAARERQTYVRLHGDRAAEQVRSSFRRNLKKRGSVGHNLEFLGFEVETRKELVLSAAGSPS